MRVAISVQGKVYKTIDVANTGEALTLVAEDIAAGLVPDFNPSANQDIVISPAPATN
jgi:hypothetical protein